MKFITALTVEVLIALHRLVANVAHHRAARAGHFITPALFYELHTAFVTLPNQRFRHFVLDVRPRFDVVFLFDLVAPQRNVRYFLTQKARLLHALLVQAPEYFIARSGNRSEIAKRTHGQVLDARRFDFLQLFPLRHPGKHVRFQNHLKNGKRSRVSG